MEPRAAPTGDNPSKPEAKHRNPVHLVEVLGRGLEG